MKSFDYHHGYTQHRQAVSHMWLLILQYIFFTAAIVCIIMGIWNPVIWIQAAVTAVVLLFAGAVCKSGRQ